MRTKLILTVGLMLTQVATASPMRAFLWSEGQVTWLDGWPGRESRAMDINNVGQIVGGDQNQNGEFRAFLWESGKVTQLGVLPGRNQSMAIGINELGQIVGYSSLDGNNAAAFLWQNGVMTELGRWLPTGVNEAGMIVGGSVLWHQGTEMLVPGFTPFAINDLGDIVGGNGRPVLLSNGIRTNLPLLQGDNLGWGSSINNAGQIVGASTRFNNRPVLWQNGTVTPLYPFSGGNGWATDINSTGQVVGRFNERAFFWENGNFSYLGIDATSIAYAINDSGQIVGSGIAPSPEPSTFALALGVICGLIVRKKLNDC